MGRTSERGVLRTELASVATTGLRSVVVTGESGMGKTMLLADLARSAERTDVTVLYGASDETGIR